MARQRKSSGNNSDALREMRERDFERRTASRGQQLTSKMHRLVELEATIEQGSEVFVKVGLALAEIRNDKLYRERGHATFEAYCEAQYSIKRSRAYQLIDAAKMSRILDNPPRRAEQAAELIPLAKTDPAAAAEVWQAVIADGKPTAAKVRAAVKARTEPEPGGFSEMTFTGIIDPDKLNDPGWSGAAVADPTPSVAADGALETYEGPSQATATAPATEWQPEALANVRRGMEAIAAADAEAERSGEAAAGSGEAQDVAPEPEPSVAPGEAEPNWVSGTVAALTEMIQEMDAPKLPDAPANTDYEVQPMSRPVEPAPAAVFPAVTGGRPVVLARRESGPRWRRMVKELGAALTDPLTQVAISTGAGVYDDEEDRAALRMELSMLADLLLKVAEALDDGYVADPDHFRAMAGGEW